MFILGGKQQMNDLKVKSNLSIEDLDILNNRSNDPYAVTKEEIVVAKCNHYSFDNENDPAIEPYKDAWDTYVCKNCGEIIRLADFKETSVQDVEAATDYIINLINSIKLTDPRDDRDATELYKTIARLRKLPGIVAKIKEETFKNDNEAVERGNLSIPPLMPSEYPTFDPTESSIDDIVGPYNVLIDGSLLAFNNKNKRFERIDKEIAENQLLVRPVVPPVVMESTAPFDDEANLLTKID
jgi:hypothetical protein